MFHDSFSSLSWSIYLFIISLSSRSTGTVKFINLLVSFSYLRLLDLIFCPGLSDPFGYQISPWDRLSSLYIHNSKWRHFPTKLCHFLLFFATFVYYMVDCFIFISTIFLHSGYCDLYIIDSYVIFVTGWDFRMRYNYVHIVYLPFFICFLKYKYNCFPIFLLLFSVFAGFLFILLLVLVQVYYRVDVI